MKVKSKLMCVFAFLMMIHLGSAYIAFSLIAKPHTKSCLREWFPENETIAVYFDIEEGEPEVTGQAEQPGHTGDVKAVPAEQHNYIHHTFYNGEGKQLGKVDFIRKDLFTHVTKEKDIITLCVDNYSPDSVKIHYNITMNIYNNDHSRVADKNHLRLYDEDLTKLEELTDQFEALNEMVVSKTRNRAWYSEDISSLATKLSGWAILFIFIVKMLEIMFLKRKLKQKKIL